MVEKVRRFVPRLTNPDPEAGSPQVHPTSTDHFLPGKRRRRSLEIRYPFSDNRVMRPTSSAVSSAPTWQTAMANAIGGRAEQQDRAGFWCSADGREGLWLVADGMGGHTGGALAAQTALDVTACRWPPAPAESAAPDELLEALCLAIHAEIHQRGARAGLAPHCTLVALYLRPDAAWWLHVGDSRLYRFRGAELLNRTRDHSVVQGLVDQGLLREDEIGQHPDRNVLVNAVGGAGPPRLENGRAALDARDTWVLCTDGLWEAVSAEELAKALAAPDLKQAADALVLRAVERNGPNGDNVTVLLLRQNGGDAGSPDGINSREETGWRS